MMHGVEKQASRQQFDCGVTPGNSGFAEAAFPSKNQIAQHRNIVPGFNILIAMGAVGGRKDNRLPAWDAIDAYIKKTAEQQADKQSDKIDRDHKKLHRKT